MWGVKVFRWTTLCAAAFVAVSTSGCWLQFGANAHRTAYVPGETTLTASNVGALHQVWSRSVGTSASAPVVNGGRVFVSSGATMSALATTDGSVLWQRTQPEQQGFTVALDQPGINGANVEANYSIAALGGTYTFDQASGSSSATARQIHTFPYNAIAYGTNVTAVDVAEVSSGGSLSTVEYAGKTGFIAFGNLGGVPAATHPMISGNFVYVGSGSSVLAFPLDTCPSGPVPNFCFPAWNVTLPSTASMPVGISNTQVAVAMSNGNVAVLDATTGALQFTATTGSTNAQPPTVDGAGSFITGTADGRVRAFPVAGCGSATCAASWVTTTTGGAIVTQPVFAGGVVYVGTAKGHLQAFAAHSCQSPFCVSLADITVDANATSMYVVDNNASVYATTSTGKVVAYQAS